MISDLVTALGLVFVIEGVLYALAPARVKSMLELMQTMPTEKFRGLGLAAAAFGVLVVWFAKAILR